MAVKPLLLLHLAPKYFILKLTEIDLGERISFMTMADSNIIQHKMEYGNLVFVFELYL